MWKSTAQGFDALKMFVSPRKKARNPTLPGTFDGRAWYPEEFYEFVRPYFDNPGEWYALPQDPDTVPVTLTNPVMYDDCMVQDIEFPTLRPSSDPVNDLVSGKYCTVQDGGKHPAAVFLMGWGRSSITPELQLCRRLARKGLETCILYQPYSQRRTPPGDWSGERFISGNIYKTVETFRQIALDTRTVLPWLRKRHSAVGIIGYSTGGILADMVMVTESLDFAILILSGADLAGIVWEGALTTHLKADIQRGGITREQLYKVWSISDPQVIGHHNRTTNVLILGSCYDTVMRPQFQRNLWMALNRPPMHWFNCAHYSSWFYHRRFVDQITGFLNDLKVL